MTDLGRTFLETQNYHRNEASLAISHHHLRDSHHNPHPHTLNHYP